MKQSLNYNWNFIDKYEDSYLSKLPKESILVNIPHTIKEVPYNYFDEKMYQKIVTYEKEFDMEDSIEKKAVILHFEAFMLKARIILNNCDYGEHISGYLPIDIDVSDSIKQKHNRLLVILDSRENGDYPPFGFAVDYLTFSGIYREVSIETHPLSYLKNIYVHADMNGNVDFISDKVGNKDLEVEHTLLLGEEVILQTKFNSFKVDNPKLWDIDNPILYTLKTVIKSDDGEETYINRFGFRNAVFRRDGFYLNEQKIKLTGLNRHQGYPYVGYAMPKSIQEDDAELLKKELGVNIVRTSHYPQSEHFLNKCDELGLLVVNEIPGWQHIGKSEVWRTQFLDNAVSMVLKERNHACLIAHGVRIDESVDDHELYEKSNLLAHNLDPYRQTLGVRNFKNSELLEDIYAYNDFISDSMKIGLDNPKHIKSHNKPYLITEYMGHMYPVKATSDEKDKINVALRHAKVIDDSRKYDRISGAIGWCFVDYHSHKDFGSGDRICAHGVLDLYRNKKYTASIYASQQDKFPVLEVLNSMKPGDINEAIYGDIYVATNCDYIELYKNNEFVSRFYPNHKKFKYLNHPPILVDDIVGETFKEDMFNKKSWPKIAKCLSYSGIHGYAHMKKSQLLYFGLQVLKHKIPYSQVTYLWNKYVGSWGGIAKTYTFKGYKDNKIVKEVEIGPSTTFDLEVSMNKKELINQDTYDGLRISLRHIDEHKSLMQYSNRIIEIESFGPIKVLGDKHQTLLGGQLSLYVLSTGKSGIGKISIKMDDIVKTIEIPVR